MYVTWWQRLLLRTMYGEYRHAWLWYLGTCATGIVLVPWGWVKIVASVVALLIILHRFWEPRPCTPAASGANTDEIEFVSPHDADAELATCYVVRQGRFCGADAVYRASAEDGDWDDFVLVCAADLGLVEGPGYRVTRL